MDTNELTIRRTLKTAFRGKTTAAGAGDGSTLICSALIGKPDIFTGKQILLLSGPDAYDLTDITNFNPGTGAITVLPTFLAQVNAGIYFSVLNSPSLAAAAAKILSDGVPFAGANIALLPNINTEATYADDHNHNRSRVFGLRAPQTATQWGDPATLTPYAVVSGNNTWGPSTKGLGTADTPVFVDSTKFDHRRIVVVANTSNTVGRLRIIWGSPSQTDVQSIAAGQWSEEPFIRDSAAINRGDFEFRVPQITVGWQVWYQYWNATNLASISYLIGIHEYNI